ncbi:Predicted acetyltransferase, GNAT superfamily [Virgibacillus subterraneus]|uniref:Predicted acetyltransferase, GNAT superfamily n=2 Tax=Virgibacillus TaxID=84406 RepID=A0A1H1DJM7_9BACI|nr:MULTISPECIES: GNAT family N-acetyltransferase [Virgibacillus]SDQ76550.1 Predicted acetyltransferase, GNAT superfamily [Virgibacillus salinus]SEQ92041.1 Predicted acetyltransferase, GNAT superfamily [Virgibacillus subterraneus]
MNSKVEIHRLSSMKELHKMQEVEEAVWQMSPNPVHQTYTALNHGGVILGAFDGQEMVGFLYSFAGFDGSQAYLCSHMLGILPGYRKDGLGERMKLKQAEVAQELGYSMITWTFDPLESLNAYLNLHKLGATGAFYKKDHYGSMNDELNEGLPTDRIQIEWDIYMATPAPKITFDENKLMIDVTENGVPKANLDIFNPINDGWFVAVPDNFQSIKKKDINLAKEWRQKTREAFQLLFNNGFIANNFIRNHSKKHSYYYFTKK